MVSVSDALWTSDPLYLRLNGALNVALDRRGLPTFDPGEIREVGNGFEEKFFMPMTTFEQVCAAFGVPRSKKQPLASRLRHHQPEEPDLLTAARQARPGPLDALGDVGLYVPIDFEGELDLESDSSYSEGHTRARSAHEVRYQAQLLADLLALPEDIPPGDNLEIGSWFDRTEIISLAGPQGDLWRRDLAVAFYCAFRLRAAQWCIAHRTPMVLV